jgi:tRNA threonylcarbamoyladenosine biosynthesis protein TsaE
MPPVPITLTLQSPEETAALAVRFAKLIQPGDVLLLSGGIGAGKTHFARALIQSLQDNFEDVPSPTFTLVQIYETRAGTLWHTDLYRLSHPDEVVELGLTDVFETAVCLIEWPDRLGTLAPENALTLAFDLADEEGTRYITLSWKTANWDVRLEEVTNAAA